MSSNAIQRQDSHHFIKSCFLAVDFAEDHADQCANLMSKADLIGQEGHGVFRLPQYIKRIKSGGMNTRPKIEIIEDRTAMALIDADNAMDHLVMSQMTNVCSHQHEKTKTIRSKPSYLTKKIHKLQALTIISSSPQIKTKCTNSL